jgi:PAS domain S-box-containing protein
MTSEPVSLAAAEGKSPIADRVCQRFGILPNFFRLGPETPEITEKLWAFAEAAYLDIPLPSLFKERLFVYLSRFCPVRYCVGRHVGFLIGLGRPAGDPLAPVQSVEDVIRLLQRDLARGRELDSSVSFCESYASPLADLPASDSQIEEAIFALASHVFLQTDDAQRCLNALDRLLGPIRIQYLLAFLTFIRAAHYWTKVHPELQFEEDINELLRTHETLAACILKDAEAARDAISLSILEELPKLRERADKAVSLLAAIVDSSDDAIVSKNLNGIITSWNQSAEKLFGYSAQEAIGQHVSLIIPRNRLDEETTIIDRIRRGERIEHFDTVRIRKDGREVDVSLTISPVLDATGQIIGASKIARDIGQRKQSERELLDSEDRFRTLAGALDMQVQFRTQELQRRNAEVLQQTQQLQDLSQRLLRAQDEERRHIARELHDSAGQSLAAMGMALAQIENEGKLNPAVLQGVENAQHLVQQLTREIRTTSYLLHPPLLDETGLSSAVRWYVEGLSQRSGLEIELKIPEQFGRLPRDIEIVIFRLVQECLTNIHRHSGSKTAIIRIAREDERVSVEVQDRGKGIPRERLAELRAYGGGVGIRGMRERLRPFKGELIIDSNPLGTKIRATLLAPARPAGEEDTIQNLGARRA